MYDVYDPKEISFLIFHKLHNVLSRKEEFYDDEIKLAIIQIFKEILPNSKIEIQKNGMILVNYQNKKYEINLQYWVDSLKNLYNHYLESFGV